MKRIILILSILSLALAACGTGTGDSPANPGDTDLPAPTLPPDDGAPGDPGIDDPGVPPAQKPPTQSDKVPPDAGEVFIDTADLLIMESFPIQVRLDLAGTLPTPCHGLSWVVNDDGSTLSVTVFSIQPGPAVSCIAVEEPFQLAVDLGAWDSGSRVVEVNGDRVGEFSA